APAARCPCLSPRSSSTPTPPAADRPPTAATPTAATPTGICASLFLHNGRMIGNARSCADPVRAKTNGTTAGMGQGRKLLTFRKLLCIAKLPWRSVVVSTGPYPEESVAMNFEVQSYLSHHGVETDPPVSPTRDSGLLRVR